MNARNLRIFSADGVFGNHRYPRPFTLMAITVKTEPMCEGTIAALRGQIHGTSKQSQS
jgi:hypothetical protein